jgi:anthranilate/para-aminobenzoate synthase component I
MYENITPLSPLGQFLQDRSGYDRVVLPYQPPLRLLQQAASQLGGNFSLLHSSQSDPSGNHQSLLATQPLEEMALTSWEELQQLLATHPQALWVGNLEYEMGQGGKSVLTRYARYYLFDNRRQQLECFSHPEAIDFAFSDIENHQSLRWPSCEAASLTSNMRKQEYLEKVAATLEQIRAGEFYQANLTRRFAGDFTRAPQATELIALFSALCEASPAGYAALLKRGDSTIISSSPESFLSITDKGEILSRPIKGTARRSPDAAADAAIREQLQQSEKNRAENLMIVDLMRNDLAIHSVAGSVEVQALYEIQAYPHLYHLVSTIKAQRQAGISSADIIRACFPPASMTGAPKKRVMEWCRMQEPTPRGIYSGALGWLAGDGSADLSVVIRTLRVEGRQFRFQVGGGIVADSNPLDEWEETLTKAAALCKVLCITRDALAGI